MVITMVITMEATMAITMETMEKRLRMMSEKKRQK